MSKSLNSVNIIHRPTSIIQCQGRKKWLNKMHFSGFNFTRLFLLNRQCFFTSITSTGILWSGSGVVLDYGQALLEIKKTVDTLCVSIDWFLE